MYKQIHLDKLSTFQVLNPLPTYLVSQKKKTFTNKHT